MRKSFFLILLCALFFIQCKTTKKVEKVNTTTMEQTVEKETQTTEKMVEAPIATKKDSILEIHGDKRIDPYFWMRLTDEQKNAEKPDKQTQQVLDYLHAENKYTKSVLQPTEDLQKKLFTEIVDRIKKDDESVPYFDNGYWYYTRFEKDKEYAIYCRKKESLEGEEEILIDGNLQAKGHDYYRMGDYEISPDNKIMAFSEDTVSRNIFTMKFKNLETGDLFEQQLNNTTGSGAWANDNKTFFYTTKNEVSLLSEKIWRHKLNNSQKDDEMVYHEKDPSYYIGVYKSKSDKYVIIYNGSTLVNDYHILNANNADDDFQQFTPRGTEHEYNINHFEDKFYIVTNWEAENFRLMETPETATAMENWVEVIPHRTDVLLNYIEVFKNYLVVSERGNALTQLKIINQKTKSEHYIEIEEPAYVIYSSTNPEFDTNKLRFGYSSLTTPNSQFDYNMETKERILLKQQEIVGGHNPEGYKTERFFVVVRDGVEVPMTLVYKKDTELNENTPTMLYSYGSYGSSTDPWFRSPMLSLLNRGFVFAIAHVRGGQEMGRQWYDNGKMFNKKNTFTDFVDCANYLIDNNYTSAKHLYAEGGSAGGLLMGAIANMSPQSFNGIIADVPFVDVVSTMLDETIPLTTNEFDEWGNPKNKDSYEYMLSYSPYDQVQAQAYPNMLVVTGLFDSQVQYWEPAKWVAKLRDLKTDNNLLLLDTNMEAGHGGASGRFEYHKETAKKYAFLFMLEGITE